MADLWEVIRVLLHSNQVLKCQNERLQKMVDELIEEKTDPGWMPQSYNVSTQLPSQASSQQPAIVHQSSSQFSSQFSAASPPHLPLSPTLSPFRRRKLMRDGERPISLSPLRPQPRRSFTVETPREPVSHVSRAPTTPSQTLASPAHAMTMPRPPPMRFPVRRPILDLGPRPDSHKAFIRRLVNYASLGKGRSMHADPSTNPHPAAA